MTKKISSTKPCGRNSKKYNGAFLKCFSILEQKEEKMYTSVNPRFTIQKKGLKGSFYTDVLS